MRTVFMGTPDLASVSLQALLGAPELEVVAVATQPDRPKGRNLKPQPSPVKVLAEARGLPVLQPTRARDEEFIRGLRDLKPEVIAVAAFGQILPPAILALPRLGCLNVHTSLLPRYRGAAPIQWAILNDDAETGVTIMKMDAGLDTGDILAVQRTPITPEDTAESLHDRLALMGAKLLVETIRAYAIGSIHPRPQPSEGLVLAPKIRKDDGRIDWARTARHAWNRVRGLRPWPGAFTFLPPSEDCHQPGQSRASKPQGHLLKIWRAEVVADAGTPGEVLRADKSGLVVACGEGALSLVEVQPGSGRRMDARQFLAGHPLRAGQRFD